MSKLTRQDFYCGAGLALLLRKNEHASPSEIGNVNDVDGKNVVGLFYKIKTKSDNEAIIYIKFSTTQQSTRNLSKSWRFSLTNSEKEKINTQLEKNLPFFMILICVDHDSKDNLIGEIALLTQEDYNTISSRSNIIIGLWSSSNDDAKLERQKVYVVKKGNGTSREYYFNVKRRRIETPLDELIERYYPNYKSYSNMIKETTCYEKKHLNSEGLTVYVTDNPKECPCCQDRCTYGLVEYIKNENLIHKINVATCPTCNKKYVSENFYSTFIKGNKETNITFIIDPYIYLLDDNSFGCKRCDAELGLIESNLNIHHNILDEDDYIEKIVNEHLFYCKSCKILYVTNINKQNLLKKYGCNKIKFKHINSKSE